MKTVVSFWNKSDLSNFGKTTSSNGNLFTKNLLYKGNDNETLLSVDDLRYIVKNVDNMDATASDSSSVSSSELMAPYPPKVTVSGTDIRAKEVILVLMALCLLVCSICLFFKHWKKNYRDINQVSI